jgi:hypothetical protein
LRPAAPNSAADGISDQPSKAKEISMKRSVSKLAIVALLGGLTAVSATPARADRDGRFSTYDPTFAYTGDPAYAQARAMARRQPVRPQIQQGTGVGVRSRNLPYPDRPYGDPGRW